MDTNTHERIGGDSWRETVTRAALLIVLAFLSAVAEARADDFAEKVLPLLEGDGEAIGAADFPEIEPKAYRIGVAPSHIIDSPDVLFERPGDWEEARRRVDFYKAYALQLDPPEWASRVDAGLMIDFLKGEGIELGLEFGSFGNAGGRAAAALAMERVRAVEEAGGRVDSLHLDGPMWRMLKEKKGVEPDKALDEASQELAAFFSEVHKSHPDLEIGLIVNLPNWDFRPGMPGMLGTFSEETGHSYYGVVQFARQWLGHHRQSIAFVEVDCPYHYFRAKKSKDGEEMQRYWLIFFWLQKWCESKGIDFHLVLNEDMNVYAKDADAARVFYENTLRYVVALRRAKIFPDAFIIQSWYKVPDAHLPEAEEGTFMHTVRDATRLIENLYPKAE